jgi:L-2,4-diaminobutyric acid acetyltransferase
MNYPSTHGEFELRSPVATDARSIWQLVDALPDLDSNSPYAYLLLCSHFAGTALIARRNSEPAGFVLGYQRPDEATTAFVWQIAVAESARGCGLGRAMLDRWFARCTEAFDARFLEATVTPSNRASRALFTSFANKRSVSLEEQVAFPSGLFPEHPPHESEISLRIGPMTSTGEAGLASPSTSQRQENA